MNPTLTGQSIARKHLPDAEEGAREALAEDIRWAIIQGQIAARQPPEMPPAMAIKVVYRILYFIDEYRVRLGAGAADLESLLQKARREVCALHAITPVEQGPSRQPIEDAPVGGQRKPVVKAVELKRGAGDRS